MTFLSPWSALAAAAVVIPAIVFLYLLKLRRRPVRVSSTMLWESAVHDLQANVPFRWLRPSWLLVLHLLIAFLLLLALARPMLKSGDGTDSRVLIMLDRSASMSAADGPQGDGPRRTRLDLAKARTETLIDQSLGVGGASVAVMAFAADAAVLTNFTTSRSALLDSVRAIEPADQPADLAGALRTAETLLVAAGGSDESPRVASVALLSDGSFMPTERLAIGGARVNYLRVTPRQPEGGPDNLGVTTCSARRDYDDPARVRVFVRVENSSTLERDAALRLTLDEQPIERRAVRVPPGGESATSFELSSTRGGVVTVMIERDDALAADNAASLLVRPAAQPRVVLVRPSAPELGAPQAPLSQPWLLEDVLREFAAASLRVVTIAEYELLGASATIDADLVVFAGVSPSRVPACASLSFGASPPIAGVQIDPPTGGAGQYVLAWKRAHPILRDAPLDSVYIARASRVRWDDRVVPAEELATGVDGPLIVLTPAGGTRHLIVAFDPADSNWPLRPSFPVFLAATIEYLTIRGDERAGVSYTTADPLTLAVPINAERVELRGPATVSAVPAPGARDGSRTAAFGRLERAGLYRVVPGGVDPVVAVNLTNSEETRLVSPETLTIAGRAVEAETTRSAAREIWPWFVLGAGVLLLLEWAVYGSRMRI